MKITKSLLSYFLFLVICFNLYNCTPDDEYVNSLPDNSSFIAKIDAKDIFAKANFAAHKDFSQNFINGFTADLKGEEKKMAEKILKDPQASGISFSTPIYVFTQASPTTMGILAKVKSKKDLDKYMATFIATSGAESAEIDGVNIHRVGPIICAYNDKRFLVVFNSATYDKGVVELIKKDNIQTLSQKSGMPEFTKIKADIATWQSSSDISSLFGSISGNASIIDSTFIKNYSNNSTMAMNFEKGKISINQITYPSSDTNRELYDKLMNSLQPMSGKLLNNLPEQSILNAGANFKNLGMILDMYKTIPGFVDAINSVNKSGVEIDSIANMFGGDFVIDIESFSDLGMPKFSIIAEVSSNQLFETMLSMNKNLGISLKQISPDLYTFQNILYMYNKDGIFVMTTNKEIIDNIDKGFTPSMADAPYASLYKNSYGAMYIDLSSILSIPMVKAMINNAGNYQMVLRSLKSVTNITMTSPQKSKIEINVNFEKKDVNALEQILYTSK